MAINLYISYIYIAEQRIRVAVLAISVCFKFYEHRQIGCMSLKNKLERQLWLHVSFQFWNSMWPQASDHSYCQDMKICKIWVIEQVIRETTLADCDLPILGRHVTPSYPQSQVTHNPWNTNLYCSYKFFSFTTSLTFHDGQSIQSPIRKSSAKKVVHWNDWANLSFFEESKLMLDSTYDNMGVMKMSHEMSRTGVDTLQWSQVSRNISR